MLGRPYENVPTIAPDVKGPAARAWRIEFDPKNVLTPLQMGAYLVHAPASHPMWPWYGIQAIALKDHPTTGQPCHVHFPGASHEFTVLALNPEKPLPTPPNPAGFHFLEPADQCVQVILADDDQARQMIGLVIRAVCEGVLIPDQDWRSYWRTTLANTAEHIRLGEHPER